MHQSSFFSSSWGNQPYSDDPFVSLSNKKTQHSLINDPLKTSGDRYITESTQKSLFKDKFELMREKFLSQEEENIPNAKREKINNYRQILQCSLKKQPNRKQFSKSGKYFSKHLSKRQGYLFNVPQNITTKTTQDIYRSLPQAPYKILDAPRLKDDFYTNLLDWSKQDSIGVVLDNAVYVWSAKGNQAQKLTEGYVSSIKWGKGLLVGQQTGRIKSLDVEKRVQAFKYKQHIGRVGCMDINSTNNLVASGSKDSSILVWDTRANKVAHYLYGHKQQICGLKWSSDESYLASGGNDNLVFVWDPRMNKSVGKLHQHTAAVKALAWSPHKASLLATGGGSTDKSIKLWDTNEMVCSKTIQTGSQVCNMLFSSTTDELVSTHGYSLNSIVVWKTKTMQKVATLHGHTYRVLYLAKSPDEQSILTGSGDQTLRFWKLFPSQKSPYPNQGKLQMKNFTIR